MNGMNKSGNFWSRLGLGRSLSAKLIAYFLLVALIPTLAVSITSIILAGNAFEQNVRNDLSRSLNVQVGLIETWAQERQQDIQTLALTSRVQTMDRQKVKEVLDEFRQKWSVFEDLYVTDLSGKTIYITSGENVDLSDRSYIQSALKGNVVISDALVSRATGNIIVAVAAPLESNGKMVGVVGGTVPVSLVATQFANARLGETGEVYLVNKQGFMITAPRHSGYLKENGLVEARPELEYQVTSLAGQKVVKQETGVDMYTNYRDAQVVGAYHWIPSIQWGIIAEQEISEAMAASNTLRNINIGIALAAAILVVAAAFFVGRGIANPITRMTRVAASLAVGDIEQEIAYTGQDEVGQLADAFRSMIGYQREMAETANEIAQSNLAVEARPASERDVMGNAFQQMITNLRGTVLSVIENADQVSLASAQLAAASNQASAAVNQIATTIQQVAKGTGQQSEAASVTAASMEQMRRSIDGVAKGAQEQAEAVSRAAEITASLSRSLEELSRASQNSAQGGSEALQASQNGSTVVENTIASIQSIRSTVGQSADKVREMGERSAQIGMIVETIDDIASQTNLLALNAAIEAARAGEHGKGFAVVADEVRKLAERSSTATKEIAGLIKGIQNTVSEAVSAMDRGISEIENGVQTANEAGSALSSIMETAEKVSKESAAAVAVAQKATQDSNELVNAMDTVSAVVEENTAATEEMAAGSNEVSQSIENIASVSEENSASVEEVSASTEEMSAQVEEVTASAQSLAEMSDALNNLMKKFKLN